MARYIDAVKLIEHIKDLPTWREVLGRGWLATKYPDGTFDCEDVIISIVNAPTADVEEVRHGKWTKITVTGNGYGQIFYQHSDCDVASTELYQSPFEYCPRCGAKMDSQL